ncbi:hypothetical protein RDWZM_007561 [Blomia tropicalis]|uniref:RRM domain-containing protein n=1 Tax=Blomia tropicalis TaxID=40697 RepID=A0A9Q0LZP4_BLOTA|nr:hypothetical protein RDWZM_007561 [Blomia tropicalis]
MDPAESIFSMLDYSSTEPILQHDATFGCSYGFDDLILGNEFNLLPSDNNVLSDMFNDDLLMDFSNDPMYETDLFPSLIGQRNRNKNKTSSSLMKTNTISNVKSSKSILNNPNEVKNSKTTTLVKAPKVYMSPSCKKNIKSGAGTSILVKSKKAKRRSLLQVKETNKFESLFKQESSNQLFLPISASLIDHDYCVQFNSDILTSVGNNSTLTSNSETEVKNDLEDMLQGFIPDDVLLNEVPNCLKDLFGLDTNLMLNSEDVLHGLNDACNLMTDQYIDGLEQLYDLGSNLPNLDITEDELNKFSLNSNQTSSVVEEEIVAKDIELDIVFSPFSESAGDSLDCASETTGCTEESSSEDSDCLTRLNKSRNRSLSSSSLSTRRKRRFSSRSSLNSSDSMSDSSSIDDSAPNSRSSSPERSPNLTGFGSFTNSLVYATNSSNHPKYLSNKHRNRKQFTWSDTFSNKFGKKPTLKKKMTVIDLTHRNYNLPSSHKTGLARLAESGSSHQISGEKSGINERVLYIGNIPNGTTKSDLDTWFGEYGKIEDIQICFPDNGNNYAFITYKSSHETRNAINHGKIDVRFSKFKLSYGKKKQRNSPYKDLDLFTANNLDFRIDSNKDVIDFDTLLRSTTADSHKLTTKFV